VAESAPVGSPAAPGIARRIDHVGVIVEDADRAAGPLISRLGLVRGIDWTDPGGRFRLVYLESGDTTLQLVQPLAQGTLSQHLRTYGEGLHHVCFAVDDLDAAIESLDSGVDGAPYLGGKGARVCFLSERHSGVLIELTEDPAASSAPSA
jgi:methylmalonyl-CoA/ethylmalonyl-CoA epimerase